MSVPLAVSVHSALSWAFALVSRPWAADQADLLVNGREPPTGTTDLTGAHVAAALRAAGGVYRGLGQMRDARIILLHKNRARTRGMNWRTKWPWRILGYIQDVFVGYGYAPGRAFAWILAPLFTGVGYFAANNPTPTEGTASFTGIDTVRYPMDLLLPGIGVGGKSAWTPADGLGKALALTLIIAGWLLGVTIAAGIARALRRD